MTLQGHILGDCGGTLETIPFLSPGIVPSPSEGQLVFLQTLKFFELRSLEGVNPKLEQLS
jgi:hypothetical protein